MKKIIAGSVLLVPSVMYAQGIEEVINIVWVIVRMLTPLAFALGLLFFFYGMAMFILKAGAEKDAAKGIMIWGVIALFIMASIFGLVQMLQETFNLKNTNSLDIPSFCGGTTC